MQAYQLEIYLPKQVKIIVGKLGQFTFKKGKYIYTGSAKKNMKSRIERHLKKDKKLRWHIDYFLYHPATKVLKVTQSEKEECELNKLGQGVFPVKGFGSSDCKNKCDSHLKYFPL
jgi:Uri superfamily endonuclease